MAGMWRAWSLSHCEPSLAMDGHGCSENMLLTGPGRRQADLTGFRAAQSLGCGHLSHFVISHSHDVMVVGCCRLYIPQFLFSSCWVFAIFHIRMSESHVQISSASWNKAMEFLQAVGMSVSLGSGNKDSLGWPCQALSQQQTSPSGHYPKKYEE